jgi:hypothetical protein
MTESFGQTGALPPTHKSAIREQISPQLEELWRIHPVLIELTLARYVPTEKGYMVSTTHHSVEPKHVALLCNADCI